MHLKLRWKQLWLIMFVIFSMAFSASAFAADNEKKKIGILIFNGVLSSDVTAPAEVFGAATQQKWFSNYKVLLISVDSKTVKTAEGLTLSADASISNAPKLDALIVPSAYDMSPFVKNAALVKFIKRNAATASWVGSNCSGAYLLAEAGLLDGKKATTWAGGEADFQKKYSKVDVQKDTNFVIDGKFITSNGSVVSYEAALVMLSKLSSAENAKKVSDIIQYSRFNSKLKF